MTEPGTGNPLTPEQAQEQAQERAQEEERKAIDFRRGFIYASGTAPRELWGLALSGGGIRSATFCLGVLQALAKAGFNLPGESGPGSGPGCGANDRQKPWPLLARFDFLSTVSGGGYTGSFFSALFRAREPLTPPAPHSPQTPPAPPAPEVLATEAYEALATDPPGRLSKVQTALTQMPDRPLRWLRENGRYLAPNNTGDFLYDIAIAIRNLCAVHYVIGVTLLTIFLLMFALRYGSLQIPWEGFHALGLTLESMMQPRPPLKGGDIWFSPWFGVLGIWLVLAVIPCGAAYWLDQDTSPPGTNTKKAPLPAIPAPALAAAGLLAAGVLAACVLWSRVVPPASGAASLLEAVPVPVLLLVLIDVILAFSLGVFFVAKYLPQQSPGLFRNRITRWLSRVLTYAFIVAVLALIETAGQTLYLWLATSQSTPLTVFSVAGVVAALVAAVKQFAPVLAQPGKDGLLSRLPLNTLLGAIGLALALLLAVAWNCAAAALLFGMQPPLPGLGQLMIESMFTTVRFGADSSWVWQYFYPVISIVFCLTAVAVAGYFLGFINLSSLQVMYGARLTRAYLGASNKARFESERPKMDVTEADASDDFTREAYYRNDHLGPAHLINVTINATTGTGDQLTQRDRQGLPLAVTPAGITVDGRLWNAKTGNFAGTQAKAARRAPPELSIGQWVGVSGAAFSTGLGRGTALGQAMLFTIINIRLGWWWNSGKSDPRTPFPLWRNQTYLQRELRARFLGTDGSHWYLSDGGHFENTGVFELLRRRVDFIVCCDCGADPNYSFEDLANLMRLARIDFGAEFECVGPSAVPRLAPNAATLAPYFARDESELRPATDPLAPLDEKCALLYRVRYASSQPGKPAESILLVLKPRLIKGAPLDLFEYQTKKPSFPQQTTFDQFFDEAQWESYRKLGVLIGSRIFR